jgi:ribonuclease inhibitor
MIKLVNKISINKSKSIYILLDGLNIQTPFQLYNLLNEKLTFPDYFGQNLDALYDVMTDLSWSKSKVKIDIVHYDSLIKEDEEFRKSVLGVLFDIASFWADEEKGRVNIQLEKTPISTTDLAELNSL